MKTRAILVLAAFYSLAACEDASDVGLLTIEATGLVAGIGYIDENSSGGMDAGDLPLDSVEVVLGFPGDVNGAFTTVIDSTGAFLFPDVLAGQYEVRFDESSLGDSLRLLELTPLAFTLGAGDSVAVTIGVERTTGPSTSPVAAGQAGR
ncbi:MAG: hypothetical protein ACR2QM_18770 [Longimicrobiales bacterium]